MTETVGCIATRKYIILTSSSAPMTASGGPRFQALPISLRNPTRSSAWELLKGWNTTSDKREKSQTPKQSGLLQHGLLSWDIHRVVSHLLEAVSRGGNLKPGRRHYLIILITSISHTHKHAQPHNATTKKSLANIWVGDFVLHQLRGAKRALINHNLN